MNDGQFITIRDITAIKFIQITDIANVLSLS